MNKTRLINELKSKNFPPKIIKAFEKIKREKFITKELKTYAYENKPLPIAEGATISQPYTIAFMLDLLELEKLDNLNPKILEIGSGSGYVLALISEISKNSKIYGIERIKQLVIKSKKVLKQNKNIKIIQGDGSKGLPKQAPYDRILVSATADQMPKRLFKQLENNGIIICPVKNSIYQIKKIDNKIQIKDFPGFIFVPLIEG